jgi:hypothetical protein
VSPTKSFPRPRCCRVPGSISALLSEARTAAEAQHDLNAFLELFDGRAREKAAQVDVRMKAGDAGPLAGHGAQHQGQHLLQGPQGQRQLSHPGRLHQPVQRHSGGTPARRRRGHHRPHQLRRVRHGQQQREQRLRQGAEPAGPHDGPGGSSGGAAAAWPQAPCTWPWAAIPEAASASPPLSRHGRASSPPTGASAATA